HDQRRVREPVVHVAPGEPARDGRERAAAHVRTIRVRSAIDAAVIAMAATPPAQANPSASASGSQPTMNSDRIPSSMYETGFQVATVRNQSVSIRSRGSDIEDRNSAAKKSGNTPW